MSLSKVLPPGSKIKSMMEQSTCVHLDELKRQGGVMDYHKVLFHIVRRPAFSGYPAAIIAFCVGGDVNKDVCILRCFKTSSASTVMYSCLHCCTIGCKACLKIHSERDNHPLSCELNEGGVYCFRCADFIFEAALETMRETTLFGRSRLGGNVLHFPEVLKQLPQIKALTIKPGTTIGLRGLVNLGHTCYLNCILQIITHTPVLRDFFLQERLNCNVKRHEGKTCILNTVVDIFQEFYNGSKKPIYVPKLLAKMAQNAPHLAAADQHDAHEFFAAILESLFRHFYSIGDKAAIENFFHGTLRSTLTCLSCRTESVKKETFTNISLEVFGNVEITLEECLKKFTHIEELETSWCESCGQKNIALKQLKFENVPLILSLHFKRFQSVNADKWEHHVRFPTVLNVSQFMSKVEENEEHVNCKGTTRLMIDVDLEYCLYAVVVHKGSVEGGHYFAYINITGGDQWIKCDDHTLTVANLDEVLNCKAYMLFYHRAHLPENYYVHRTKISEPFNVEDLRLALKKPPKLEMENLLTYEKVDNVYEGCSSTLDKNEDDFIEMPDIDIDMSQ